MQKLIRLSFRVVLTFQSSVSSFVPTTAQDRASFCIFHIIKEILVHLDLIDRFIVGNHCQIFSKVLQVTAVNIFKGTKDYH